VTIRRIMTTPLGFLAVSFGDRTLQVATHGFTKGLTFDGTADETITINRINYELNAELRIYNVEWQFAPGKTRFKFSPSRGRLAEPSYPAKQKMQAALIQYFTEYFTTEDGMRLREEIVTEELRDEILRLEEEEGDATHKLAIIRSDLRDTKQRLAARQDRR
jgi:hypothetical protein